MHANHFALSVNHRRHRSIQRPVRNFKPESGSGVILKPRTPKTRLPDDRYHPEKKDHIRAIAEAAAKDLPESTDRVNAFSNVLRTYASMVMRYHDRFVVGDYFTVRLKQAIPKRERKRWRLREKPWTKHALEGIKEYLRLLMASIVEGLERVLLNLAKRQHGKRIVLPRNRMAIRVRASEGCGRFGMLITEGNDENLCVVDLQSMGEFDRTQRNRFKQDRAYVRPRPGQRKRYAVLH